MGSPVRHSLSPVLHNAAFRALGLDWAYVAFEVAEGDAAAAIEGARALGIDGLNVTMPHKAAVADAVDRLTPAAAALGSVNTVIRQGGVLVGDNTDGVGFLDALRLDKGFDPTARRVVVIGAGGAARAIVAALGQAGAADIAVVNRTAERAAAAAQLAPGAARVGTPADATDADLVVNATPLGMPGKGEELPLDPALLGPGQLVVDIVYHPAVTPFMAAARERGAVAANGLGMLIHQAAHAFRQWTSEDPPLAAMSAAVASELAHSRETA
jgi:shikimate dehydrogenase